MAHPKDGQGERRLPPETSKHHEEGLPAAFHTPPGSIHIEKPRGKLGHKYQSWDPSGEAKPSELRNYVDNTKILGMP